MMLKHLLIVGAGGMLGSMLRYLCSVMIRTSHFPLATLLVNATGSLAIGIIIGLWLKSQVPGDNWRLFLVTGLCGGFTTFSAFSLECVQLLQQQRYLMAALYISLSVVLGLAATFAGIQLTKLV
ncbi:MAG: crcB [Chitinophagaceae bacterium]|jgi:CrcB protein|nr:crcB [Chitinophagaceae bacterium]